MLNCTRYVLLPCLLLLVIGQQVAAQDADDAISEEGVAAEQASEVSGDAADAEAQAAAAAAIAQKLANPVASLISVPIQINYDDNYGLNDKGSVWRTNVQPVIPISLNDDWNMISRTIVPIVKQSDVPIQGVSEAEYIAMRRLTASAEASAISAGALSVSSCSAVNCAAPAMTSTEKPIVSASDSPEPGDLVPRIVSVLHDDVGVG